MNPYVSIFIPIICATLLGGGTDARARDDAFTAQQFFGVPGGWTFEPEPPTVSTFITADDAIGFVLFLCNGNAPGFVISLSTADDRERGHDALLQVFPALGQPDFLLGQFSARSLGEHALQSPQLPHSATAQPRLLLDIIRNYPTGIRLNIIQLRHDRFTPPRAVDVFLPQTADAEGLPMEVALPLLEESCRVR
jgi:hypothetical protein